ncbi:MAG: D-aminoacyl-tRNA deacylase [Candidatus Mucispirillum faecigallinarum]|nr:D-aminoacyl-tRNA deacylase [Mucispirillum sp.]MDY5051319.1 D-aminoacyl-tRNA deacylase [Candidatus Mucispirillum faecigallinarum]
MIAVVQRVYEASVKINGEIYGSINNGLLVFFCVENGDTDDKIQYMSEKILNLRIFEDDNGKMSKSLQDINGDMLIISQFTLAADCSKGRRPDFTGAAKPDIAKEMYNKFIEDISSKINGKISSGQFGADMKVSLINDGPVTMIIKR